MLEISEQINLHKLHEASLFLRMFHMFLINCTRVQFRLHEFSRHCFAAKLGHSYTKRNKTVALSSGTGMTERKTIECWDQKKSTGNLGPWASDLAYSRLGFLISFSNLLQFVSCVLKVSAVSSIPLDFALIHIKYNIFLLFGGLRQFILMYLKCFYFFKKIVLSICPFFCYLKNWDFIFLEQF